MHSDAGDEVLGAQSVLNSEEGDSSLLLEGLREVEEAFAANDILLSSDVVELVSEFLVLNINSSVEGEPRVNFDIDIGDLVGNSLARSVKDELNGGFTGGSDDVKGDDILTGVISVMNLLSVSDGEDSVSSVLALSVIEVEDLDVSEEGVLVRVDSPGESDVGELVEVVSDVVEGGISGVGGGVEVGDLVSEEEGRADQGVLGAVTALLADSGVKVAAGLASSIAVLGSGVSDLSEGALGDGGLEVLQPGDFHIDFESVLVSNDEALESIGEEFGVNQIVDLAVGLASGEVLDFVRNTLLALLDGDGDMNVVVNFAGELVAHGKSGLRTSRREFQVGGEVFFVLNGDETDEFTGGGGETEKVE